MGNSKEATLLIVVRKADQERWPEIFDTSAAAAAAAAAVVEVEPAVASNIDIIASEDTSPMIQAATDNTAAADTAAGIDVDVVEDSAELDIAAPSGVPVTLGPSSELGSVKDAAASAGPSAPWNKSAANAAAQSASVMGQAVLLQTRLMYQLF